MATDTLYTILAVDLQPSILRTYTKVFSAIGHTIATCPDLKTCQQKLAKARFDVLIIDLSVLNGSIDVEMHTLRTQYPDLHIIAMSQQASITETVQAMRAGCHDYLCKPVSMSVLERALLQVGSTHLPPVSKPHSESAPPEQSAKDILLGEAPCMQRVHVLIDNFAKSSAPVLILGESGTGKEVCAHELHSKSERAKGPFVPINCAALPNDLMESELFGHVKGAFTGAHSDRTGAAEAAHGGTLFLDEIGEMDISLQAKLLRFLQVGEIKKIGADKTLTVDVRVVCATNRNLKFEVEKKQFREDLFYRLNVLSIMMPPLRERGNDLVELAKYFYDEYARMEGVSGGSLSPSAIMTLVEHDWPGNVRELQNVIRRAVVMNREHRVDAAGLLGLEDTGRTSHPLKSLSVPTGEKTANNSRRLIDIARPLAEIEREIVEAVIEIQDGSVPKAANKLHLSPSTLYRKREGWFRNDKRKSTAKQDEQTPKYSAAK